MSVNVSTTYRVFCLYLVLAYLTNLSNPDALVLSASLHRKTPSPKPSNYPPFPRLNIPTSHRNESDGRDLSESDFAIAAVLWLPYGCPLAGGAHARLCRPPSAKRSRNPPKLGLLRGMEIWLRQSVEPRDMVVAQGKEKLRGEQLRIDRGKTRNRR